MDELAKLTDPEAEFLTVGSILIDDAYLPETRAVVAPEDFTQGPLRLYYRAMLALADRGVGVDVYTLKWEVMSMDERAWKPSIAAQMGSLPTACHARHYAERVHDLAERRRMLREAQQIAGAALDITKPIIKGTKGGVAQV